MMLTVDAQGMAKAEAEQFINEAKTIIREKGKESESLQH